MTGPKIGGLFEGYGGLSMGVQSVLGGELAWYSDICRTPTETDPSTHYAEHRGPCRILAHHHPGVPNHGDVTAIQWLPICGDAEEFPGCGQPMPIAADRKGWECHRCQRYWTVEIGRVYWPHVPEPVDVLTGGSPCQDLSHAGKRAGMTTGTRSNLWVAMREGIASLRPSLVVWENVRGAYSACADSEMGRCPRCVDPSAPGGHDPRLRALGRVLGDLSDLGYDAVWHGLRAADVGAPHGRFRVFVIAWSADQPPAFAEDLGHERGGRARDGWAGPAHGDLEALSTLPTPKARDWKGTGPADLARNTPDLSALPALLPAPRAGDGEKGGPSAEVRALLPTPVCTDALGARNATAYRSPDAGAHNSGTTLTDVVWQMEGHVDPKTLIPTPSVADSTGGHERRGGARGDELLLKGMAKEGHLDRWGPYGAAIARWEARTGPAPSPTDIGPKGNPRLAAAFSEWLMGIPPGHVTDVPGITRNEALKACGNGVVPQQAAAAIRYALPFTRAAWLAEVAS